MPTLPELTRNLQRELGLLDDGVAGPVTIAAALHAIRAAYLPQDAAKPEPPRTSSATVLDPRSEAVLAALDPKAVPMFRNFLYLAKATAATYGCDYVLVSGHRTWAEQDELYAQGRSQPGEIVTRAKGGQSNHNFGVAVDAGVFQGKVYLDEQDPDRAAKIHRACSEHAAACGLQWGGNWKSITDLPHYEVVTGLSMEAKRARYQEKGSVL